ncbi:MAG: cyclic pyranopterin monophosphate synthase MoaC [Bacteroidota bacterium]
MGASPILPPPDSQGRAQLDDLTAQSNTVRTAVAVGRVRLGTEAFDQVRAQTVQKGDVLSVAQVAGILGAKQTSKLIPLCHDVQLKGVDLSFELDEDTHSIEIRAYVKTFGPTGVEMEAMTAVSIAALVIYDMCKSISKELSISDVHLRAKTGGQSGDYRRGAS